MLSSVNKSFETCCSEGLFIQLHLLQIFISGWLVVSAIDFWRKYRKREPAVNITKEILVEKKSSKNGTLILNIKIRIY